MSAIAGFHSPGGRFAAEAMCGRMLDAQAAYGPHDRSLAGNDGFAAGRCLYRLLPEDRFDRQPLASEDGRFLLVADVRIDNREELVADLGGASSLLTAESDAALLFRSLLQWGEGLLDRLAGNFAFALWDAREEAILLARDPTGERPLCYHQGDGFFAFASMPQGLRALPMIDPAVDEERVAQFVADVPLRGPATFFRNIRRLEPGTVARVRGGEVQARRYWQPDPPELRLPSAQAYVEALREQLDRATRCRLRRAGGSVGSQLSSGFDSSAVTATAAMALAERGERLFAFTSAPRAGFAGLPLAGRIADESPIAAETAAMHANIDHVVLRPSGASPLSLFASDHALMGQPVGHVCNNVWWSAIDAAARERGVTVMLTGENGNMTLSAGDGLGELADLIRTGRWADWSREARALLRQGNFRWRSIVDASLGPWLPRRPYERLGRLLIRNRRKLGEPSFVGTGWRREMDRQLAVEGWDERRPRNSKHLRRKMLELGDPGNFRKKSLAEHGIDERDPTSDRRLASFCLSLPPEAFLKDGQRRPLLTAALADRLPPAILDQQTRGYQMADWYEQISQAEIRAILEELDGSPAAAVVDLDAMRAAVEAWPRGGWETRPVMARYRMQLLRALSAAHFVNSGSGAGNG